MATTYTVTIEDDAAIHMAAERQGCSVSEAISRAIRTFAVLDTIPSSDQQLAVISKTDGAVIKTIDWFD